MSVLLKHHNFSANYELPENFVAFILNSLSSLKKIVKFQMNQIKKIFIWEHARWSAYLIAEGWQSATIAEAIRYINAGNNEHHQNFLAKIHPCLNLEWSHLETLAKELEPALGKLKDFRKLDEQSIFATSEILAESVLNEEGETPTHLRRLFCINRDELFCAKF